MGQIEIAGADALAAVQQLCSNDASRLKIGQAHYSGLMTPQGTFVDDLLVYRLADEHFLMVVNASNVDKDFAWIVEQLRPFADASAVNTSARYALIALQGPLAREVLQTLTNVDLSAREVLLVHPRRGGRRAGHHLADGLHGRERVRDLRAAAGGGEAVGGPARGGAGRRRRARRPRRPRHAAPRGGHAALRQRHRRHDDACSRPTSSGSSGGGSPTSPGGRRWPSRRRRG